MEKEQTNLSLRIDVKEAANKAIDEGLFGGIISLSGLVEHSLIKELKTKGIILDERNSS